MIRTTTIPGLRLKPSGSGDFPGAKRCTCSSSAVNASTWAAHDPACALATPAFPEAVAVPCTITLSTVDELDAYFKSLVDRYPTPVVYVAHPVGGAVAANIKAAFGWMSWLLHRWPRVAFIAPWIVDAHVLDDGDPIDREAGLLRDEAVVSLADSILLVGGRVSVGMERERIAALHAGGDAVDFTRAGASPPVGA